MVTSYEYKGIKDMTTGETLKYLRIKAGLTQAELSFRTRISNQQISFYECGRNEPRFDVMCKLIKAMGYEIEIKEKK